MSQLDWAPLTESELPDLVRIARACLERDGGLPELAEEDRLRALMLTGHAIVGRDPLGEVVAAAALGREAGRRAVTGLVDPSAYGQGIGAEIVLWAREQAAGAPLRVIAETMSPETEALLASAGLHRVFAETVMRHDLRHIPFARRPDGVVTLPFTDDTSVAFDHAYQRSFVDQPGYVVDRDALLGRRLSPPGRRRRRPAHVPPARALRRTAPTLTLASTQQLEPKDTTAQ